MKYNNELILFQNIYNKKNQNEKEITNLKELFENDKKMLLTNCSTPSVSSSPSSIITSNNNNSIISVSGKNGKTEWILTSCKEISLNFTKI